MTARPRVLIVDDVYGRAGGRNRDRELFCARLGIADVSGDAPAANIDDPVAEAVLYSGQVEVDGRMENDLEGVVSRVLDGWRRYPRWAMVMLDMHFQTGPIDPETGEAAGDPRDREPESYFGLRILDRLLREPELVGMPIVILSAMERDRIERRFAREGVFAFVEKDRLDRDRLSGLLWEHGLLEDEAIVGRALPMLAALRDARRLSRLGNANMLVLGETGTGKELLAEYIHRTSGRDGAFQKLFVRANEDMFSADLFGYVRGAFTGAVRDRPGQAELADGGTLLFDEFGDIPPGAQDKLMRLLDTSTRESQRIGDTRLQTLDLQVVMATNRFEILREGFRRDLLQRANASNPVILPPLRDRPEDIPLLTEFFVRRQEKSLEASRREISADALELLSAYSWPGNVRELEHEIVKVVSNYRDIKYLSPEHIVVTKRKSVFPVPLSGAAIDEMPPPPPPAAAAGGNGAARDVHGLIENLGNMQFRVRDKDDWQGRFEDVQSAYARLMARYLNAALEVSAMATGKAKPTTAVRLILGKKSLRTSDAASAVKRLLSISRPAIDDLLEDESLHLGRTLAWAENLRGGRRAGSTSS